MKSSEKSTYPFFETIRIVDGQARLLPLHQERIEGVFRMFYPHSRAPVLSTCMEELRTPLPSGRVRCRMDYNESDFSMTSTQYTLRPVRRLKLVESTMIYPYKSTDRSHFDALSASVDEATEPVIVDHGRIRETTFSNILCLIDGQWLTPQYPIFYGIMRRHLLAQRVIEEADITFEDLSRCERIKLVNAMMPPDSCISIDRGGWD